LGEARRVEPLGGTYVERNPGGGAAGLWLVSHMRSRAFFETFGLTSLISPCLEDHSGTPRKPVERRQARYKRALHGIVSETPDVD
jgi:hypothetical protein